MQTRSGLTYNTDDNRDYYLQLAQGFIRWKNTVNQICYSQTKMTCDDLPDQDYYSSFVEGVSYAGDQWPLKGLVSNAPLSKLE